MNFSFFLKKYVMKYYNASSNVKFVKQSSCKFLHILKQLSSILEHEKINVKYKARWKITISRHSICELSTTVSISIRVNAPIKSTHH